MTDRLDNYTFKVVWHERITQETQDIQVNAGMPAIGNVVDMQADGWSIYQVGCDYDGDNWYLMSKLKDGLVLEPTVNDYEYDQTLTDHFSAEKRKSLRAAGWEVYEHVVVAGYSNPVSSSRFTGVLKWRRLLKSNDVIRSEDFDE